VEGLLKGEREPPGTEHWPAGAPDPRPRPHGGTASGGASSATCQQVQGSTTSGAHVRDAGQAHTAGPPDVRSDPHFSTDKRRSSATEKGRLSGCQSSCTTRGNPWIGVEGILQQLSLPMRVVSVCMVELGVKGGSRRQRRRAH
jgi:hypothetical protein